jgi:hypothetical protein
MSVIEKENRLTYLISRHDVLILNMKKKIILLHFQLKTQLYYITKYTRSSGGEMREKHNCTGSQKHNPAIPETCEDISNSNRKLWARLKSYLL